MIFKNPKGTRDFVGEDYNKYIYICNTIEKRFKQFGGIGMKTPIFELRDILMKKYGDEAEKEIFSVEFSLNKNQEENDSDNNSNNKTNNKESLALRYDQTVPFTRYLIQNGIKKIRRYQIGNVYRIDTPNLKLNRLREFTQADFDFVGEDPYEPELEMLKMINLIMEDLGIENYRIEYNFRQNLFAMFQDCGVDQSQFLHVSSVLDRLDKIGWKNIEESIGEELCQKIKNRIETNYVDPGFSQEFINFQQYLNWYNIQNCLFKPSLSRGLDYYTGFIFEIFIDGFPNAVAGGGRYDNLIRTMKGDKKTPPKLAGFSLGIERLMPFVNYSITDQNIQKIFLICLGKNKKLIETKMKILNLLRTEYPNCQVGYMIQDRKLGKEIRKCLEEEYNYMILFGETEYSEGKCKFKDLKNEKEKLIAIEDIRKEIFESFNLQ